MRKRSTYKPRPRLANPMLYVMESVSLVSSQTTFIRDLHIKNHLAMTALTRGEATKKDVDLLICMHNVSEALWRLGYGKEYESVIKDGKHALLEVAKRGAQSNKFVLKAGEMTNINLLMELHDAQLAAITIKDLDAAVAIVRRDIEAKRVTAITTRNKETEWNRQTSPQH